uniref:Uncharacterized protein n=1 Tax=Glossina palpalis gambiensis TaxID=67801 RepID=A0A1B0B0X3_9MUSC
MSDTKCLESRLFVDDAILQRHRVSDYKENYVWKTRDPLAQVNPSLAKPSQHFKPFYEKKIKFLTHKTLPPSSVTHSDFLWEPDQPKGSYVTMPMQAAVANTPVTVEYNKSGYGKYLDTQATTQRLDYCYRSPNDIMNGIAAHDNITFWNWKNFDCSTKHATNDEPARLCDNMPSIECEKRRCEFINQTQRVPNSGMTTEVRENYLAPADRDTSSDYDNTQFRSDNFFDPGAIRQTKTEYSIIGSGDPTEKFV